MSLRSTRPARSAPRVLVIDDDEPTRRLIAEALGDDGYTVAGVASGAAALKLLASGEPAPDVILLDWWGGSVGGRAFADAYRQLPPPRAPLLVVTAAFAPDELAREAGAAGYLRKPFDLDDLTHLVAQTTQRSQTAP